jgi:hypothetical protein
MAILLHQGSGRHRPIHQSINQSVPRLASPTSVRTKFSTSFTSSKRDINDVAPGNDTNTNTIFRARPAALSIESQLIHIVIRLYNEWQFQNLKMRQFVEGLILFGLENIKSNRERKKVRSGDNKTMVVSSCKPIFHPYTSPKQGPPSRSTRIELPPVHHSQFQR